MMGGRLAVVCTPGVRCHFVFGFDDEEKKEKCIRRSLGGDVSWLFAGWMIN